MDRRVGSDCCAGLVGGEAELEGGFLVADVGEGVVEAGESLGVVVRGLVDEGEQSLFHDAEAGKSLFVGEFDLVGRCFVQRSCDAVAVGRCVFGGDGSGIG